MNARRAWGVELKFLVENLQYRELEARRFLRRPKALKGANGAASERCERVGRELRVLTAMRSRMVSEQNDGMRSGGEFAALGGVA